MINVNFWNNNTTSKSGLWQWNYGQVLRIEGLDLPTATEIHFSTQETGGESVRRIGVTKDGVTDVVIPDSLLENNGISTDYYIYAFIYVTDGSSGQTEYVAKLEVKSRPKPEAFNAPGDDELFREAIKSVNDSADRSEKAAEKAEKMLETVTDIENQVIAVESYKTQAVQASESAINAANSAVESSLSANEAARSAIQGAESALNSATSANEAKESAEQSALSALSGSQSANESAMSAMQSAQSAKEAETSARGSAESAGNSASSAIEAKESAEKSAQSALQGAESAGHAQNYAQEASQSKESSALSAQEAKASEKKAQESEANAKMYANSIQESAEQIQKNKEGIENKLDKQQGIEHAGKALVIGEDGNVIPGEVQGGAVDLDTTLTQSGKAADAKATGDRILQFAIKNTASGESPLIVSDSAEEGILGLGLTGKTEQFSTKGANLCDNNAFALGVLDNSGQVSPHTKMYVSDYIPVKPSTQYARTILGDASNHMYDKDKQHISNVKNTPFTTPSNAVYCRIMATKDTFETNVLMFNEGSKILPYEPYTGGKPSPSPDYPQEIVTAGKLNEDTQKYEVGVKITGKNLFDINDFLKTVRWTVNEDGSFVSDKPFKRYDCYIPAKSVFSADVLKTADSTGASVLLFHHVDGSLTYFGSAKTGRLSVVLASPVEYIEGLSYRANTYKTMQIEFGKTVSEYEPYREPQSLTLTSDRPITTWDKLVEQDGQIGWLYGTEKVKIDGTLSWSPSNLPDDFYFTTSIPNSYGGISSSFCKNYRNLQDAAFLTKYKNEFNCYGDHSSLNIGDKCFRPPNETITTLAQWKEWITENPLELLNRTKTTEFVPLQQSEQEAIRALATYYPTTVITTDGGELNPDVELDYVADTRNFVLGQIANINKALVNTQAQLL